LCSITVARANGREQNLDSLWPLLDLATTLIPTDAGVPIRFDILAEARAVGAAARISRFNYSSAEFAKIPNSGGSIRTWTSITFAARQSKSFPRRFGKEARFPCSSVMSVAGAHFGAGDTRADFRRCYGAKFYQVRAGSTIKENAKTAFASLLNTRRGPGAIESSS